MKFNTITFKLKELIYNLANGLWSGFPLCCTFFYTKRRFLNPGETTCKDVDTERGISWPNRNGPDYVQCDKCFKSNYRVKNRRGIRKGRKACIFGWIW